MESTELFALSATFERSPPLATAPFTHPNNPAGAAAESGGGTEETSPLLAGITGLEKSKDDSMVGKKYTKVSLMLKPGQMNIPEDV
jgi:hypothetical protein